MVVGGCRWFQVVPCFSTYATKTAIRSSSVLRAFFQRANFPEFLLRLVNGVHIKHLPYFLLLRTLLNDTFVENFSVETVKSLRFGPCDLVFVPLAPAFTGWRPFWNKVYMSF